LCWAAWPVAWPGHGTMRIEPGTLLAILGMALATYATRAGGIFMLSRARLSPSLHAWLRHVPGAVLVAVVAPLIASGGAPSVAAGLATALVAWRTNNLLLAIAAGVGLVFVLRNYL